MWLKNRPSQAEILSVTAATLIALACGTNYVYSAWGPRFAQRLKLTSTESNLIGTFGNIGMYMTGIPFGMVVDTKGPRWGVALGTVLFGIGYYPLAKAFDAGPGVYSVVLLCLLSFSTGAGSAAAFGASIKAAALSLPHAQGVATAFPLAGFGLSAFFFATLSLAFPHDTSHFLMLLAVGTVILPIISLPFLRTPSRQEYRNVPQDDSSTGNGRDMLESVSRVALSDWQSRGQNVHSLERPMSQRDDADNWSLSSRDSADIVADLELAKAIRADENTRVPDIDVRGFRLLTHLEFYQLLVLLGLLAGMGLMTINNIGNDLQALWRFSDPNTSSAFIAVRQATFVSTLSICNFAGRLLSGIGSDILTTKYHRSRLWCALIAGIIFAIAQLLTIFITVPDLLILVAATTGLAYGMTFGVYPSLLSHAFGVHGLSQNWGTITLAPGISGNILNVLYGRIFDGQSIMNEDGTRICLKGRSCYSKAYLVTWTVSLAAIVLCCWTMYYEHRMRSKRLATHQRVS